MFFIKNTLRIDPKLWYVLKANELETQVIVIQLLSVRFVVRKIGLMRAELLFFLATCNKIKLLNEFGHERTIFKMNLVHNSLSINYKWNSYHKVKSTGKRITVNNITLIM